MKYLPTLLLTLALLPHITLAADKKPIVYTPPPVLLKPQASGVYQDSAGASHAWSVGQAHGLTWDGTPYLPVGASFVPLTWTDLPTDANWALDKAAMDMLSKRGVHDILLSAGDKGLTHASPAAVQRVVDYLEANHFNYGLRIADRPADLLVGTVVKPAVYRNPSPSASGPTRFSHIPGLISAFYLLVSPHDGTVDETGTAQIIDSETAQVTLKTQVTDDVLLLYPQRAYPAGTPESRLPDLWEGYDEYRDRLLGLFSQVKLGPGLRFFLDPLTDKIGFAGEVDNVIPTSDGYQLDFQAWLNKKYNHNVDDLNRGWGITDHDVPDFATAARCLPLWSGSRGVPAVYDPLKKATYAVLNKPHIGGHVWDDLTEFRVQSVRGYMNGMADVLKKGVADVPVLYAWGGRSALFTNSETHGGFDGLGMTGADTDVYAFAQAEDTPRTSWLIADGADASRPTLNTDWDALKNIGARGFFATANTTQDARRLGDYGASISFQARDLTDRPRILPYPAGAPGINVGLRHLPDGVWWLPSYRAGNLFQSGDSFSLGPLLHGYKLNDPDGLLPRFVVWSPHGGLSQVSFPFPKDSPVEITDAAGIPLNVQKKKGEWVVPVGPDPIILTHLSSVPLPSDAADAADAEAVRLLALAKSEGMATDMFQESLFQTRNTIPTTAQDSDLRYNAFARLINSLTQVLQPFVWLEAESATSYTFDSLVSDSEASGGSYLSLDTDRQPPSSTGDGGGGYQADYTFTVNAGGSYALWISSSPLNTSSPFTYTIDDGGANTAQDARSEGDFYAGKFVWNQLGSVTLSRGSHKLTINVIGPRPADRRYVLAIDTFCLSRVPFHPSGTQLPAIELLPPPVPKDKNGKPIPKKNAPDNAATDLPTAF
ncbi:MAG: hypothetical protein ACRYFS_03725 [Janthinobacterium lividum]